MDRVFWRANWTKPPVEEFERDLAEALSTETWVCDGNYSGVSNFVDGLCDTVVWLDLPWWVSFPRLLRRTVVRSARKEVLWGHCQENFRGSFLSRDSILVWHVTSYARNRRKADRFFGSLPEGVTGHRLRSPASVRVFLSRVGLGHGVQTVSGSRE